MIVQKNVRNTKVTHAFSSNKNSVLVCVSERVRDFGVTVGELCVSDTDFWFLYHIV